VARLLALVLAVTGLVLVAPTASQAGAAITAQIPARLQTVDFGEQTSVKVILWRSSRGSTIVLQHRHRGVWQEVQRKRLWSTRTHTFRVRPPRGYQRYRVVKPTYRGEPRLVSRAFGVAVRWTPTVTAVGTPHGPTGRWDTMTIAGVVSHASGAQVELYWYRPLDGKWYFQQVTAQDAEGRYEFTVSGYAGYQYRIQIPEADLRGAAMSPVVTYVTEPYHLVLNEPLDLVDLDYGEDSATVEFDAVAGQELSFAATAPTQVNFEATFLSPSGQEVSRFGSGWAEDTGVPTRARFVAPEAGTYTIRIYTMSGGDSWTMWGTTTATAETTIDQATPTDIDTLPGQILELTFAGEAGQYVTFPDEFLRDEESYVLVGPSGVIQPSMNLDPLPVYRLPEDATYTLRDESGTRQTNQIRVLNAPVTQGAIGGPDLSLTNADLGRVALVQFPVTTGQRFGINVDRATYEAVSVFDADGARIQAWGDHVAATTGVYTLALSASDADRPFPVQLREPLVVEAAVDGPPVPVDTSGDLPLAVSFTGRAGQVVALRTTTEGGSFFDYRELSPVAADPQSNFGPPAWELPSDGTYEFRAWGQDFKGTVSVVALEQQAMPFDGTPATVSLDEPGEMVAVRVDAPAGVRAEITLSDVSPALADDFAVQVFAPDGYRYDWFGREGSLHTIPLRPPGRFIIFVSTWSPSQDVGSVTLSAHEYQCC
jgi:hypothetical protein